MSNFSSKVVIVTGASSGIGAATAFAFAKRGALLTLTGRNEKSLSEVAIKCKELGATKITTVIADLNVTEECSKVTECAVNEYGRIDVLVNNAGICSVGGIETVKLDDFDAMFNVNVKAMLHLTQLAVPYLKLSRGNVVNVSSCVSTMHYAHYLVYGMTKAAVCHFTQTTAKDLVSSGVRINAVKPGLVKTKIHTKRFTPEEFEKYYEKAAVESPLGRAVETSEVADAILYLASDSASSITGVSLNVDGGYGLKC